MAADAGTDEAQETRQLSPHQMNPKHKHTESQFHSSFEVPLTAAEGRGGAGREKEQ